jgi:hypothetical protein
VSGHVERDQLGDEIFLGESFAVDLRVDERRHEVVGRRGALLLGLLLEARVHLVETA